jgi:ribosomal 30S subunit maturation factor RimM
VSTSNESLTPSDAPIFQGSPVVDEDGQKIGKVTDVLSDDRTLVPQWVVVELGLLGAQHYVPLEGAYQTEEGPLVIPFDKRTVKQAPRAHRNHILSKELEGELRQHYGIAA